MMGMPTEFGRYRVRKQLGGGGMGAVYLVENTELRREEALKVPHFGVGDDPEMRERFLREARAAAQLDHANLCPVYDVGTINGVCFLTMRYLKGKLLSDYTGKPQPPRKAVEITAKLAQALEAAHAKGVIHRDLKPNNVMMCAGVGPVVMDFGLAKQIKSEDQKLTQAGTTMGTPSYMPPEQVKGELDRIGPASDVYSLGVILFEMLTGRLPFKAATVAEVYGKILHTEAPAPSSLRPGLDPALDAICAKALAKTPEGRYPSMKAFAAALIDFLKTAPAAEGAGNLTPMKAGPAEIFQAATVAPNQAAISTPALLGEPTQRGNKAPSSIRKPANTQRANPRARPSHDKEGRGGVSAAGVLGWFVLVLLMLGALGGVGYLIYTLNQKKAAPSPDVALATQPASRNEELEGVVWPAARGRAHPPDRIGASGV
jgi:serine/threonine protein kinase